MGQKHSKPPNPFHPPQEKGDEKCAMMELNPHPNLWWKHPKQYRCVEYGISNVVSVFGNEDAGGSTDPNKIRHKGVKDRIEKRSLGRQTEEDDSDDVDSSDTESEDFFDLDDHAHEGGELLPSHHYKLKGRDVLSTNIDGLQYLDLQHRPSFAGMPDQAGPQDFQPSGTLAAKASIVMAAFATPTALAAATQTTIGSSNVGDVTYNRSSLVGRAFTRALHQVWEFVKPMSLLILLLFLIALVMICMVYVSRSVRRARSQDEEVGVLRRAGYWAIPGRLFIHKDNQIVI